MCYYSSKKIISLVHHDMVVMHSCSGQCGPSSSWDKGHCISSCWIFKDLPVTICCGVGGPLSSLGLETTAAMFSAGSMVVMSTNVYSKVIQLLTAVN